MTVLNILDERITDLSAILNEIKNSNLDERQTLEAELVILQECEDVLLSEELIAKYDFSNIISLLQKQNFTIENIERILTEVKQVIEVKKIVNEPDLPFSDAQINALAQLRINLKKAKENLQTSIQQTNSQSEIKDHIDSLEELRKILSGESKNSYYTEEMVDSFLEVVDWENMPEEDFDSFMAAFYKTKNLREKQVKEKESLEDVIDLYKVFLPESEFIIDENNRLSGKFAQLITKYSEEITTCIDLDNTREILQFFKDKGILENFRRTALLKITLFAKSDYVKKLYDEIISKYPNRLSAYYEDVMATAWVCDSASMKKSPFRVSKNHGGDGKSESLYSQCHEVTNTDIWKNVQILLDNADMFSDKANIENFGAFLKAKTSSEEQLLNFLALLRLVTVSSWIFRKNIDLFKKFNIGKIYDVPLSSIETCDTENKIHLAIELGLLNPPMDSKSRIMEEGITTSKAFLEIPRHKDIHNNSIRNYFQRNVSVISRLSINEYAFLKYKLDELGPVEFYNYFFSETETGKRNKSQIDSDMEIYMPDRNAFVANNFITEFYDQYIPKFDEYDVAISNYNESIKVSFDEENGYFDNNILNDELIRSLEENHTVMDVLEHDGEMIEMKNGFIYRFGDTLISRYKVLHNASILKAKYGYLDQDMLMTSIVRNSFLNEEEFSNIKSAVIERGISL